MDIVFPKLILFPVLVCNYKCPYCVNIYGDYSGTMPSHLAYRLEPASKWVRAIRSLRGVHQITIGGGEPGLHPEIGAIINAIPDDIPIVFGTNGSRHVMDRLLEITRRDNLWVQVTFHASQVSAKEFAECMSRLLEKFRGRCGFHTVGEPRREDSDYLTKTLGQSPSWHGYIADETGMLASDHPAVKPKLPPSTVSCPVAYWVEVAPNGDIYACHQLMYAGSRIGILGNVFDGWVAQATEMTCPKYGHCHPCDLHRFVDPQSLLRDYLANPRRITT